MITRNVLFQCALREYSIQHFFVHQYTLTNDVTALNHWSYYSPIRVCNELKRGGALFKTVHDVPHSVTMSIKQATEAIICKGQNVWGTFPRSYPDIFINFNPGIMEDNMIDYNNCIKL